MVFAAIDRGDLQTARESVHEVRVLAEELGCSELAARGRDLELAADQLHLSRDQLGALAVVAAWGFSPAAVSAVMFIRMYVWLTVFVLAMLILHVQFLQMLRESSVNSLRREYLRLFISMTVVSFLGFMTQYYYLIALFFAGIYTAIVLLRYLVTAVKESDRKMFLRLAGCYVCSQAAAGIIGVLYYPAALSHIFRGYRGKEAQAEFLNVGNTFGRVRAFFSLVSRYAFGGWMLVFLIAALAAAVAAAVTVFA